MQIVDAVDFRPDRFEVAPKHEWRIFSMGPAKRTGVQARFCLPNCDLYIQDKDKKCGRFYECKEFVFDQHKIKRGDNMVFVMFGTEADPPYDGVGWWVSEAELIRTMGTRPSGEVDLGLGRRRVEAMIRQYNELIAPTTVGIVID